MICANPNCENESGDSGDATAIKLLEMAAAEVKRSTRSRPKKLGAIAEEGNFK
jgi:hypothetical protein